MNLSKNTKKVYYITSYNTTTVIYFFFNFITQKVPEILKIPLIQLA